MVTTLNPGYTRYFVATLPWIPFFLAAFAESFHAGIFLLACVGLFVSILCASRFSFVMAADYLQVNYPLKSVLVNYSHLLKHDIKLGARGGVHLRLYTSSSSCYSHSFDISGLSQADQDSLILMLTRAEIRTRGHEKLKKQRPWK